MAYEYHESDEMSYVMRGLAGWDGHDMKDRVQDGDEDLANEIKSNPNLLMNFTR